MTAASPPNDRPASTYTVLGLRAEARSLLPGLHVVATPIGNLADMTLRGLATLAAAEAILAEDTRVTRTLLAHYGITTPMLRYDAHGAARLRTGIVERLRAGAAIAIVSDAGTPLVSDPGSDLVAACAQADVPVFAVPGASAVLAALVVSGLLDTRFCFAGFLPARQAERRRDIRSLAAVPATLVFFEAPHRLAETLDDLVQILGDRPAVVARELTKLYETVRRGRLADLAARFRSETIRGEIVVMVGGPEDGMPAATDKLDEKLLQALAGMSVKDAAAVVAADLGLARRDVYARALLLLAARDAGEGPAG